MVRKKFKMIAVDFDGTLLNDKKQLTKKTIEILRKKREDGYYLIGATARTLNSVKYNVDISLFDYLLLNNGLNIYDVKSNKIIFTESLSYDFCIKIFEILEPAVYKIDFCGIYNYYFYSKLNESKNSDFEIKITKIEDIKNINIARINAFFDNVNYLQEAEKIISRNFQNLNCITMNNKLKNINHLVIMPSKTNKYNSISYLCNKLNIPFTNTVIDAYIVAKQAKINPGNYKLGTVVKYLGLKLEGAHRAFNDAYATAQVLMELNKRKV